MKFLIDLQKGK